ncbi:MAG: DUF3772 domain-containing protein [Rhodobacteraceae bacterium]|nr:DUF3772 domain-containing protein [Paracoccaceae bacterium]
MRQALTRIRQAFWAILLLLAGTAAGWAEFSDEQREFYASWIRTAERAEDVIDAGRASNAALEVLRRDLVQFREDFNTGRTRNRDRIATLEAQINALGPVPEDQEEAADIADIRARLTERMQSLQVPQVVSDEAYRHANGLISEIDTIIRERRRASLLERGPTPLNPEHWPEAWRDLSAAGSVLWNETISQIRADTTRKQIMTHLPPIIGLLAMSLLLLTRGRHWASRLGDYLRQYGGRGTGVWSFVVSLVQVALPYLGVVLLVQAISLMEILGVRGSLILASVPYWALILLAFHWLSDQLYSARLENDLVPVRQGYRAETKILIESLAILLVINDSITHFEQIESVSDATRAVVGFPLILFTALILLRLQRIGMRDRAAAPVSEAGADPVIRASASRLIALARAASYLLGYVAPLLAVLGYMNAAEAIIYPVVLTLLLLASLLVLQRFIGDLWGWISGKGQAARDSLVAVLAGFALALVSVPVFALIWGARVADLTELWAKFLEGFRVGETTISPTNFLTFVVIFAAGYMLTRLVQGSLRNSVLPKTRIDPGGQNAIVAGLGYVGIFLAAVIAVTWAGLDLSGLAIVAGALSVGIGFGLQTVVSNFVSGIILLVERPISKGDWIEVGGLMGYVRDISVRSTRIETFDRTDVIVPNSDLIVGTVTNYTRGNTVGRVIVPVGVAYGTDTRKVEAILGEIARAHPMVLGNPAPSVVFQGFGADSLDFEIRAILRDVNWVLSVKSDMNYEIAKRFEEEGIEIPFAQRDIWLRNPEALRQSDVPDNMLKQAEPSGQPIQPDLSDMSEGSSTGEADGGDHT